MQSYAPDFCIDFLPQFNDMHPTYSIGYDPDLAMQYAESSGLAGQTLTLLTDGLPHMVTTAEIVQDMFSQIGVTIDIRNYDPATLWTTRNDPEAVFDLYIEEGISPNWRVADGIVNGVRYSPILSAPGAFPNNEYYLELAPKTLHTYDEALRLQYLEEALYTFMDNAITYSLFMYETAIAISTDIDTSSVRFILASGEIRNRDLRWAS